MKKILLFTLLLFSPVFAKKSLKKAKVQMVRVYQDSDYKEIYRELFALGKDDSVDAVVLDVDHSGGWSKYYCQVGDMIEAVKKKKPVVSFVRGNASSAGYFMICMSDYIIAHSLSRIGHMGTIYPIFKMNDYSVKRKDGVNAEHASVQVFSTAEYKTTLDPFSGPLTDRQRNYIQDYIQEVHDQSLTAVAEQRKIKKNEHALWADGKEFIALESLQLRLIDQIGTLFDVEKVILKLLKKRDKNVSFADEVELVFSKDNKTSKNLLDGIYFS